MAKLVDEQAFLVAKGLRENSIEWQQKATAASMGIFHDLDKAEAYRLIAKDFANLSGRFEALAYGMPPPDYHKSIGDK